MRSNHLTRLSILILFCLSLLLPTSKLPTPKSFSPSAIATIVLSSHGIAFTPVAIPTQRQGSESFLRILRDTGQSLPWLTTGRTGASLNPRHDRPSYDRRQLLWATCMEELLELKDQLLQSDISGAIGHCRSFRGNEPRR